MGLLDLVVSGVTEYQMAKLQRPDSPWIPNVIEYGLAGAPATSEANVTIDNATGEVIGIKKCKRRRRKRRLATASDLKDLAALKAILGGGKALDTWVATRGR